MDQFLYDNGLRHERVKLEEKTQRVPLQNAFEIFTAANFIDYGDVVSYLMFLHFRFKQVHAQ